MPLGNLAVNEDWILECIRDLGVDGLSAIRTSQLRFDSRFRKYCAQNLCGNYNRSWTCPPNSPSVESIATEIVGHPDAVVFKVSGPLRFTVDWKSMMRVADRLGGICASITDKLIPTLRKGAVFGYGPCKYCKTCAFGSDEPCRFPDKRIHSLECACVDVADISRQSGLPLEHDPDRISFFGLLVYEL